MTSDASDSAAEAPAADARTAVEASDALAGAASAPPVLTPADALASAPSGAPAGSEHEREVVREALTMALYVSLSLLAVLITLPSVSTLDTRVQAGFTVLVTAIGLVLAHHVAFRLSTKLVNGGLLTPESVHALKAQALGGLPVAVIAALPVFVLGQDPGETVSELILLGFVALVGYRSARFTSSKARSLLYVCGLVVVVSAVLVVKSLAGH